MYVWKCIFKQRRLNNIFLKQKIPILIYNILFFVSISLKCINCKMKMKGVKKKCHRQTYLWTKWLIEKLHFSHLTLLEETQLVWTWLKIFTWPGNPWPVPAPPDVPRGHQAGGHQEAAHADLQPSSCRRWATGSPVKHGRFSGTLSSV